MHTVQLLLKTSKYERHEINRRFHALAHLHNVCVKHARKCMIRLQHDKRYAELRQFYNELVKKEKMSKEEKLQKKKFNSNHLLVIFIGLPFTLLYNYLSSILRAVGDSRTPFLFLAFSAILNIFLDLFCIIVLKWGCAGAAIATITAQAVCGLLCLGFIIRRVKLMRMSRENQKMDGEAVKELLMMGLPTGLQFSITAIGSMVMQSANNSLGSIYVSGFTAAVKIKQFALCPFDAMATAVSVFCSQNLGAGQAKRIRQGLFQGMVVAVGYGIFAGLVLIVFGRSLSMMFLSRDNVEVLDASAKYLRCMGFFYWSLGILNVSRMVTQGLGFSGRAFFSGVTEMIARIIVSVGFVGTFGYTAICFADQTAWVSACCYIFPTCLYCMKKVTKLIQSETPAQADSLHA